MRQTSLFDQQPEPSTVVLTAAATADAARRVLARIDVPGGAQVSVVTSGTLAARALGVRHRSLTDVARQMLSRQGLRFANGIARRTALRDAIEDVWGSSDPVGAARAVQATVQELLRAGAGSHGGVDTDDHPRLERLLRLVRAYRERLAVDGLIDGSEALWLASSDAEADVGSRMLVAGYPFMTAGEAAFLAAHAPPGSCVVLPGGPVPNARSTVARGALALNEDTAAFLTERGWRLVRESEPVGGPAPRVSGYRLASPEAEVRHALTAVKRLLLDGTEPADIALVAADPSAYGPVVIDVANEYEIAVHTAYSEPLAASAFGHLVGSVLRVVTAGLPFEDTARLLRNRLVEPMTSEAWTDARRRLPRGVTRWERFDPRARLFAWPSRATRSHYLELLESTLGGLGVDERLGDEPRAARHRLVVFGTYTVQQAEEPVVALADFASEFLEHLELVTVPAFDAGAGWFAAGLTGDSGAGQVGGPTTVPDAVALVSASALVGAVLSHVFVLGAAEGVMPRRLDPGAWMDYLERDVARRGGLAVADAQHEARQEALLFEGLLRAATESITVSYAEADDRGERLASSYFAALGLDGGAPPPLPKVPASIEELRRELVASGDETTLAADETLAGARTALDVELRRESDAPPDRYDGNVGVPYPRSGATFSATSLLALGQCAFKWFAQYALRLYEPEEADTELSPLVRGNLYHVALEEAVKTAAAAGKVTREAVLTALPDAFAIAERVEAVHTTNWELHRGQHLSTLRRVVRSDSFLPDGAEVLHSERRFGVYDGTPARWRGFEVTGRIDRIDRRSGRLVLVDYKTSSSAPLGAKNDVGDAKIDLQLPIYLEAAVPALGLVAEAAASTSTSAGSDDDGATMPAGNVDPTPAAPETVGAEYYSLTKARVIATTSRTGADAYDPDALQGVAQRAAAALDAGRYPVEPDRRYLACAYCAFDAVCRVGPRVERKRSRDG